jgi:hypothetical protein
VAPGGRAPRAPARAGARDLVGGRRVRGRAGGPVRVRRAGRGPVTGPSRPPPSRTPRGGGRR